MTDARAIGVETVGMTMRFGSFTALDNVSIRIKPGSFHALLGENGAGKSTLVKCIMGFYQASEGALLVKDREVSVPDPKAAHALGLGMVYQHFTLVQALTGAENLVISREDVPAIIDWRAERAALQDFMTRMPFKVPLDQPVRRLSAGEKQKLEILKQLYLGRRFLILDEPTSVLTPAEADEVLGHVRALTEVGDLTVLMITHKFREVMAFADEVSVLRRGEHVGGGVVCDLTSDSMAAMMVGADVPARDLTRDGIAGVPVLDIEGVEARDRSGLGGVEIDRLTVHAGEVVGIAGVSGNGQMELMEVLAGQRPFTGGGIRVRGAPFTATRAEAQAYKVRYLPEEPLKNACAPGMSITDNLAFRDFDGGKGIWLDSRAMRADAADKVARYGIKAASLASPIRTLSGGNVQRSVLARELSGEVELLIVSNPCFGLDFAAVAEIRTRIMAARNAGAAVLLMSEDLDEIMELSDRVFVMSEGRLTYETSTETADIGMIGHYMAGYAR